MQKDQIITLTNESSREKYPTALRLIDYHDPITKKQLIFLTNLFESPAEVIADYYKKRWQIELFFKWIKQNLKIKKMLQVIKVRLYARTLIDALFLPNDFTHKNQEPENQLILQGILTGQ